MSTGTMTEIQYKIAGAIPDYLADHVRMGTASAIVYALADAGFVWLGPRAAMTQLPKGATNADVPQEARRD